MSAGMYVAADSDRQPELPRSSAHHLPGWAAWSCLVQSRRSVAHDPAEVRARKRKLDHSGSRYADIPLGQAFGVSRTLLTASFLQAGPGNGHKSPDMQMTARHDTLAA